MNKEYLKLILRVAINDIGFTNEKNTAGYIYLVRDPRAVACSMAAHSNTNTNITVKNLFDDRMVGYNGKIVLQNILRLGK